MTRNVLGTAQSNKLGRSADGSNQSSSVRKDTTTAMHDQKKELVTVGESLRQATAGEPMSAADRIGSNVKSHPKVQNAHRGKTRLSKRSSIVAQQGGFQPSYQITGGLSPITSATSRRAPLQVTTRAVQVRVSLFDIPGQGPGKENIPPGMNLDDTGKEDKKPKMFEWDQVESGIRSELHVVSKNKPVISKSNKPKMVGKQLSNKHATGKKLKPNEANKNAHETATERVLTGPDTDKRELGSTVASEINVLHRSVISSVPQKSSKLGAENDKGNCTVARNDISSAKEHHSIQGEHREIAIVIHGHMSPPSTPTLYKSVLLYLVELHPLNKHNHVNKLNQISKDVKHHGHQPGLLNLKVLTFLNPYELSSMLKQFVPALHRFKEDIGFQRAFLSLWFEMHQYPALVAYVEAFMAQLFYGRGGKFIRGGNRKGLGKVAEEM